MPREKENYRDMLSYLRTERHCPDSMNITDTAKFLGKKRPWVYKALRTGALKKEKTGEITIGTIARYLCG